MDIKANAAYIKGLAEGYEISDDSKEGKIISKMLELLMDMSEKIEELEAETGELREYIEEIDEDLGLLEDDFYIGDEENEDFDEEFEEDFDNDFEDDDSGYDEFVCPSCGEIICVDENLEIADVVCPACGEKLGDIELCDGNCASCGHCRNWTNTASIREGEPGYCEHGETFADPWEEVEYNGYWISRNIYGSGEYSVQYCGDDIIFDDVNDAKDFIDSVV